MLPLLFLLCERSRGYWLLTWEQRGIGRGLVQPVCRSILSSSLNVRSPLFIGKIFPNLGNLFNPLFIGKIFPNFGNLFNSIAPGRVLGFKILVVNIRVEDHGNGGLVSKWFIRLPLGQVITLVLFYRSRSGAGAWHHHSRRHPWHLGIHGALLTDGSGFCLLTRMHRNT